MTRPGTAQARTVDLLNAVDAYARADLDYGLPAEALALRHLVECLTRIVQQHPGTAEFAETYAARAAEALDLIEVEP